MPFLKFSMNKALNYLARALVVAVGVSGLTKKVDATPIFSMGASTSPVMELDPNHSGLERIFLWNVNNYSDGGEMFDRFEVEYPGMNELIYRIDGVPDGWDFSLDNSVAVLIQ